RAEGLRRVGDLALRGGESGEHAAVLRLHEADDAGDAEAIETRGSRVRALGRQFLPAASGARHERADAQTFIRVQRSSRVRSMSASVGEETAFSDSGGGPAGGTPAGGKRGFRSRALRQLE